MGADERGDQGADGQDATYNQHHPWPTGLVSGCAYRSEAYRGQDHADQKENGEHGLQSIAGSRVWFKPGLPKLLKYMYDQGR